MDLLDNVEIFSNNINYKRVSSLREWRDVLTVDRGSLSNRTFNFLHLNIRSVRKHWDELLVSLECYKDIIDFLVLTEINLRKEESCLYNIDGYNKFTFCRNNRRGEVL